MNNESDENVNCKENEKIFFLTKPQIAIRATAEIHLVAEKKVAFCYEMLIEAFPVICYFFHYGNIFSYRHCSVE